MDECTRGLGHWLQRTEEIAFQEFKPWGREKTIVSYSLLLFIQANQRQALTAYASARR